MVDRTLDKSSLHVLKSHLGLTRTTQCRCVTDPWDECQRHTMAFRSLHFHRSHRMQNTGIHLQLPHFTVSRCHLVSRLTVTLDLFYSPQKKIHSVLFRLVSMHPILSHDYFRPFPLTLVRQVKSSKHKNLFYNWNQIVYVAFLLVAKWTKHMPPKWSEFRITAPSCYFGGRRQLTIALFVTTPDLIRSCAVLYHSRFWDHGCRFHFPV